ncbi:PREDICTED: uncharacterized protein LOC103339466 [Prunus mume]|uniref:Uncharacterized protein LOC103339466 n=1 Tax=Prunus mume TaxID=102107 RepID=A0ABM0PKN2_PRUMU|nr:PREDICTED: uncharacterized protein LOC103339466 [Prunus mume]
MEEVLERQEREIRERKRRRAASKRAQRDLDQQLVMAVAMLDKENQSCHGSHEGRAPNVDRHSHSWGKNLMEDYFIPTSLYSDGDYGNQKGQKSIILEAVAGFNIWVWHAFFGVAGSQNDLNILGQSPVFNDVLRGEAPKITYKVNNTIYQTGYYLADGIYPRWTTFVKSLPHPRTQKQKLFATYQEGYRKDVERCFGILQARWAIIRVAARMYDDEGDYGNQKGQKSIILEAVAGFNIWVWHAFFGVAGSQNDLNILGQSPVFNDVLRGEAPKITYKVNNTIYQTGYYLADGIYPRWTTFVKSLPHPRTQKQKLFATYQEGYKKDVERCFGTLQARYAIIRGAARMFDEEVLRSIMMTCIILHNMIVEDEYDYEAKEVYEPDPMNTALTRIYEKPIGPNGGPVEHEPLVRDGIFMNRMINRYMEMQSSYIHEHRQVDLMEHL